jgi:hypothetical protein
MKKIKTASVAPPPDVKSAAKSTGPTKKVKSRRGRKKERTQISVRIDKALMDLAYRNIETTGMRITDLVERGLLLAIRELGCIEPLAHHARLILHDEGVEFSRFILNANAILRFPEVRKLSAAEEESREFFVTLAARVREWPDVNRVLSLMGTPRDPDAAGA